MNKILKYIHFLFAWCFIIPVHTSVAQEAIKQDSSNVDVTYFKDGINERYSDTDFNYDINDTGGVNLIQGIFRKFFNWLGDLFGIDIDFIDYKTLEYIVYGLLALGAIYLLIKFLLQSPMSSVFKTEEQTIENFQYVEENISEVNFDSLIKKALKETNYRLATRYLYLASLKKLTNKNVIDWHYDKTNNDYLNEINDTTIKTYFKRISYIYDYVWYGEFSIDEAAFNKNKDDFNKLNKVLNG
jgi:hypothetical protein